MTMTVAASARAPARHAPSARMWAASFAAIHDRAVIANALIFGALAPVVWRADPHALAVGVAALALLGFPHGGADDRVARSLLRPAWGRAWLVVFAVPYLVLAGAVMLAAWVLPGWSALAFVLVASFHFGWEETLPRHAGDTRRRDTVSIIALGGMPFALPLLFHPEGTSDFLYLLSGTRWPMAPLGAGALLWSAAFVLHVAGIVRTGDARRREGAALAALALALALLPPLAGFALFFLTVHVPRHTAYLARRHAPSESGRARSFALRAGLAMSLAALPLVVAVWWVMPEPGPERFVRAVFWSTWALTLPHVLLSLLEARAGRAPLA